MSSLFRFGSKTSTIKSSLIRPKPSPIIRTCIMSSETPSTSRLDHRFNLITKNLQEVLGPEYIRKALEESEASGGKRLVKVYWGTATTGRPHLGYLVPLTKIADFLHADLEVTILLADVHAFLDNLKAPIELIDHRTAYYARLLRLVLNTIGVATDKLKFVTGSSYQYEKEYNKDKFRLAAITSEHDAKKAGAEVVKQTASPPLSGLLYPLLQVLDEQYLDCDMQFGGIDQRKIFTFAESALPKLGYRRRAHLCNAMVPGLAGGKMSSSDANSKVDFLDRPKDVTKKINAAFAEEGVIEGNGMLAFARSVLFSVSALRLSLPNGTSPFVAPGAPDGTLLTISRPEKFGGDLHFTDADRLESAYAEKELHPGDLKKGIATAINALLEPILAEFDRDEEFRRIEKAAYGVPEEEDGSAKKKDRKAEKAARRAAKATGDDGQIPGPPTAAVASVTLDEAPEALEAKQSSS